MKTLLVLCCAALTAGAQNPPTTGPAPAPPLALPTPPATAPQPSDAVDPLDEAPAPAPPKNHNFRMKLNAPLPSGEPAEALFEAGGFGYGGGNGFGGAEFPQRFDFTYARGGKAARSVIIQSREPDPNGLATAEEDLTVMSRLLEKAISPEQDGDEARRSMGIEVHSMLAPAAGARNLYLEGYGAVFLLNVGFPLLAPPEGKTEPKPKVPVSSEWDDARQELYGNPFVRQSELAWPKGPRGRAEPYEAEKVEDLKTSLFDALKNATHIRNMKPDEAIVVVVTGPESGRQETAHRTAGQGARAGAKTGGLVRAGRDRLKSAASRGETVMNLRVKKADVDAFAEGKLDANDFRKKAKLFVYAKPAEPLAGSATWPAPAGL